MATPLGPKQIVSFEELLMSQAVQQEALTRLLIEKRVFTKEEFWDIVGISGQGDEKEEESSRIGRNILVMKLRLKAILMNIAVLLLISSWATITQGQEGYFNWKLEKEPSSVGELKLLSMDIPQSWNLSTNIEYWATINFEADRKPKIDRVCFNFSGGSQSCVDVQAKDVTYTSHSYFRVPIRVPVGTKRIDCYAEYIRDGRTQRTNTVTYYVIILKKHEESSQNRFLIA